jgi:O-antigen ligase
MDPLTPSSQKGWNAEEIVVEQRRSARRFNLFAFLGALCLGFAFIAFQLDSPLIPIVLMLTVGTPLLIWHNTKATLYILLGAVCLFELFQTPYQDALTDRVPFFWNVNTIFQTYLRMNVKSVPLNLAEILLIIAGVSSWVRAIAMRQFDIRGGALLIPISAYIGFVIFGWVNGMATGGDFKESVQEVRAQVYFLMAYLIAFNSVKRRESLQAMMWISAICIGIKGILYTYRRYVTLAGMPLPDQGVGSHEEAFLFDAFVVLLITLSLCNVQKKLRLLMWFLLPFVITGNLATNRRAATAAMIIVVPVLLMAAYRALPTRRRMVSIVGVTLAVGWTIYYPLFKNSESMFAQPARAVKSQFEPDARDASSNLYRDAENACLMATIRVAPIQGYGYGKRMLHAVAIADISEAYEWWDLLPHNQILWVWMRVGTIGFIVFWYMVCACLIHLCGIIRLPDMDMETKATGIFAILVLSMLMIFGLLDLQLSNQRDMLFTGFWLGTAVALPGVLSPQAKDTARTEA